MTLKKGLLRITVELDGVFEGDSAHEIAVQPEDGPPWWSRARRRTARLSARATCS